MFGFSLGGFTTLVEIGGTPELSRMALLCSTQPMAPECMFIKSKHGNQLDPHPPTSSWVHDSRIKAAVIAAPAVSFLFGPGDLRNVKIPIQHWRARTTTRLLTLGTVGLWRWDFPFSLRSTLYSARITLFSWLPATLRLLPLYQKFVGIRRGSTGRRFITSLIDR
jgi:hypothetical protein